MNEAHPNSAEGRAPASARKELRRGTLSRPRSAQEPEPAHAARTEAGPPIDRFRAEQELTLRRSDLPENPMQLVGQWFLEALHGEQPEPNAIALATSTPDGQPSIRMVLLKEFDDTGVVFFTNCESRKAQELERNPKASILMWWSDVQRQIRLEGVVEKVTDEEADDYFGTRPRGSQLGAWASAQSREIPDRKALEDRVAEFETQYAGKDVPRPPNWGGYRLKPHRIEFWQGRDSRLHDRLVYERADNGWEIKRLAP